MPGTNYTWECSETRYRKGRLVFLGYDDAEFCANAWERQTYGGLGVGAGLPRKVLACAHDQVHPPFTPGDGCWVQFVQIAQ